MLSYFKNKSEYSKIIKNYKEYIIQLEEVRTLSKNNTTGIDFNLGDMERQIWNNFETLSMRMRVVKPKKERNININKVEDIKFNLVKNDGLFYFLFKDKNEIFKTKIESELGYFNIKKPNYEIVKNKNDLLTEKEKNTLKFFKMVGSKQKSKIFKIGEDKAKLKMILLINDLVEQNKDIFVDSEKTKQMINDLIFDDESISNYINIEKERLVKDFLFVKSLILLINSVEVNNNNYIKDILDMSDLNFTNFDLDKDYMELPKYENKQMKFLENLSLSNFDIMYYHKDEILKKNESTEVTKDLEITVKEVKIGMEKFISKRENSRKAEIYFE